MGNKSQILTGARAMVRITGKNSRIVGFFTTCNWSIRQDKVPAFILGRYNPAEITPTAQEAVAISMTGYRVYNNGPYAVANATALKDLLNEEDFQIDVYDRQQGSSAANPQATTPLFTVQGCRVTGWSSGVAARGVSDMRLDVIGLVAADESTQDSNLEDPGAPTLSTI